MEKRSRLREKALEMLFHTSSDDNTCQKDEDAFENNNENPQRQHQVKPKFYMDEQSQVLVSSN